MTTALVPVLRLHPGQERVDAALASARYVIVQCGRRWGKTRYGVRRAVKSAAHGHLVGWFAPTYKYALEAWRELTRRLRPAATVVSEQDKRIEVYGGGGVEVWTLDTPDPARGRAYHLVVIDEAGIVRDLDAAWQAAIRPTLTDYRGKALFLGTPKGRSHVFSQMFLHAEADQSGTWRAIRAGTVENPHIPADEVEAARRDLPPGVYAQEYEGIPADDGGNPFGLDAIAACSIRPTEWEVPSGADVICWGWDFARAQDYTVGIALDRDYRVVRLERWQAVPWPETHQRIKTLTGIAPAWGDSTGLGDPVVETLQQMGCPIQGITFTGSTTGAAGTKQKLMERLAGSIQARQVRFPDGPIRSELESFGYEYTRHGVRYCAPAGLHDDCVVALALAVHGRDQVGVLPPTARPPLEADTHPGFDYDVGKRLKRWGHSAESENQSRPPYTAWRGAETQEVDL